MSQILKSYSDLVAYYESDYPGRLRGFMPEYLIEEPANYWPVKTFAVGAVMAWDRAKYGVDNTLRSYCRLSTLAMGYQTPTFFVTPQLVAAALRTELPADLDLSQLDWPFPVMVFMLPHGSICHPTEGEAPFVCIGLTPTEFGLPGMPDKPTTGVQFKSSCPQLLSVSMMPQTVPVQIYHSCVPITPGVTFAEALAKSLGTEFFIGVDSVLLETASDASVLDSSQFTISLWRLGLTLVLLISAHHELIEYGQPLKKIRSKRTGQPTQWYGPNIVGRLYRTQVRPANDETGQSTGKRPHWVRGHLRNQPYGAKHALRKLIWVQPYRTGIEE
jgi:hypothetical protein